MSVAVKSLDLDRRERELLIDLLEGSARRSGTSSTDERARIADDILDRLRRP